MNQNSPYAKARDAAEEISQHTTDLLRAIHAADADDSAAAIERYALEIEQIAKGIMTANGRPKDPDAEEPTLTEDEQHEILLEITADELNVAIRRRDQRQQEEAILDGARRTKENDALAARHQWQAAKSKTNAAEARVQAARQAHAAARAKQEGAR